MKKWLFVIVIIAAFGVFLLAQKRTTSGEELTIFAAASLTDVMQELTEVFKADHPGIEFILNFGSSGALQIQIEQGAPVDIFASAGEKQMQALTAKALIDPATVRNFATNRLVAVASSVSTLHLSGPDDLLHTEIKQIGIGDPASVPAGQYTREALENLQLWNALQERYVYAGHVRQVLQYVEREEVEIGFVYATDAARSANVQVLWIVPADAHRAILYPIGITRESKAKVLAAEFVQWLLSPAGQAILTRYGFAGIQEV